MLEEGMIEEFFENQVDDESVQKVFERIAFSHENIEMRCKAIQQIKNVDILNEIIKKSNRHRIVGDEAKVQIEELKE